MNTSMDYLKLIVGFVVVSGLYYNFYLQPRDERLLNIAECMGEDRSRQAYDECAKLVQR
jgi:hypothetical protein